MVVLHLNPERWRSSLASKVPVKPIQHFVSPIPSQRVGVGFSTFSARKACVSGFAVRVIVSPLACERFDLDASVFHDLVRWERHVRVHVPVLHALNDVDRTVVVLNDSVEEGTLGPVVVSCVRYHASREVGCGSVDVPFEIALAQRVSVLGVSIDAERAVDSVVHDGTTCFHAAVAPHEFMHPNETRHGHDGSEIWVSKRGGLPGS